MTDLPRSLAFLIEAGVVAQRQTHKHNALPTKNGEKNAQRPRFNGPHPEHKSQIGVLSLLVGMLKQETWGGGVRGKEDRVN